MLHYLDLVGTIQSGGDVDSCFWDFANLMSYLQLDQFAVYMKLVFRARRALDSVTGSLE